MLLETLRTVFAREIRSVEEQLKAYENEADLWALPPGIANAAWTLARHQAGNLQALVGAALGGTGYVRDRDAEFARRNVPRADLLRGLDEAADAVDKTLRHLPAADLAKDYPLQVGGVTVSVERFLVHLETHLAYHLGQIDYHRRLVTGRAETVGALSIAALVPGSPA